MNPWKAHAGPQELALASPHWETLYGGARGGGKTFAGILWLLRDAWHERYRALVIRRNADDLVDWIDRAKAIYAITGADFTGKPAEIKFPTGAIIRTGHLKDDNAYTKYQGHEYHRILLEELVQIPREEDYLRLISSCRSTIPELKPRVFATANPTGLGHEWVKKRFIDVAPPNTPYTDPISGRKRIYIPARVTDNPTLMINDPGYIKMLESLPEGLRKAWRDGNWDIFEGQFFNEWSQDEHVVEPFKIPEGWRQYRVIDYGRTNPFCCLWIAVDYDATAWVYREYWQTNKTAAENAQEVKRLSGEEKYIYTVADPAIFGKTHIPETIAEVMGRHGVNCIPASNQRVAGWNALHEYLRWDREHKPKLRIFKTCYNLIRTIPMMMHDERNAEDLDTNLDDHGVDCLRYLLQTLRERKTDAPKSYVEKILAELQQKESMPTAMYE